MKTLLLTENFPPVKGGTARWLWELYRRMPRDEVVVATSAPVGHDAMRSESTLEIRHLPSLRKYRSVLRQVRALIREHGVQRIHCGRALPEGWIAWLLHFSSRVPYVCYAHGEEVLRPQPSDTTGIQTSRRLRLMTGLVLRSAATVIANSHNTLHILRDQWGLREERLRLLHPGVDTDYFVPTRKDAAIRADLQWGSGPVILTVARLHPGKGHDVMLRALPLIREQHPETLYAVVGDGALRASLQRSASEIGVVDMVRWMGEVDDAKLRSCYQQCDLFVLPNRRIGTDIEGFGMVLLEAQACAVPVIAGSSGGVADAMRPHETGLLVSCEQPHSLAQAINTLLSDPERRFRMGEAGRRWVVAQLDWDRVYQRARELF